MGERAPPPLRNTCGMRRLLPPGWTAGRRPRRRRGLEGRLAGGEAGAGHHQRQAGGGQPVPCISGLAGVSGETLRIQRRLFRDDSRELTRPEYLRLLETARTQGRERLALLLETICGTGIRCPRCAMSPWRPCTGEGPKSP
ncbi:MAG: hypothetical protein ACLTYN_01885 [Dysosmobacter welbionis]